MIPPLFTLFIGDIVFEDNYSNYSFSFDRKKEFVFKPFEGNFDNAVINIELGNSEDYFPPLFILGPFFKEKEGDANFNLFFQLVGVLFELGVEDHFYDFIQVNDDLNDKREYVINHIKFILSDEFHQVMLNTQKDLDEVNAKMFAYSILIYLCSNWIKRESIAEYLIISKGFFYPRIPVEEINVVQGLTNEQIKTLNFPKNTHFKEIDNREVYKFIIDYIKTYGVTSQFLSWVELHPHLDYDVVIPTLRALINTETIPYSDLLEKGTLMLFLWFKFDELKSFYQNPDSYSYDIKD